MTAVSGGLRCRLHHLVFRASRGRLLGRWGGGLPVLELTTTGRRSGLPRATMLVAPVIDRGQVIVVASNGGAGRHPDWFLNLVSAPEVTATIRGRRIPMLACVVGPAEAAQLWPRIIARSPAYGRYRDRAARSIPLVRLEPRAPFAPAMPAGWS